MNLGLVNNLIDNLKESEFVQNFIEELSNALEKDMKNTNTYEQKDIEWNNLLEKDLTLYDSKIITKYKDEMLQERQKILENYAKRTKDEGEMFYIYNTDNSNSYDLTNCTLEKSHEVITKNIEELPEGTKLGSVLRKKDNVFVLDEEASRVISKEINGMIKEKIKEQEIYLENNRIEGHTYRVGDKYSGRIWLYDLDRKQDEGIEGIEEIEFPKDLYETAKEGDKYIYLNGIYKKVENS